jgi:hypothetical protein
MNALIIGYAVVAVSVFVMALYCLRDEIRSDDDPVGTGFATMSMFIMAACWPLAAAIFVASGLFWVIGQAITRMMP